MGAVRRPRACPPNVIADVVGLSAVWCAYQIKQLELELRVARRESASVRDGGAEGSSGREGASSAEESSVAIDMLQVSA